MEAVKNRDPEMCSNAIQDFWNRERELIRQGQGTREWSLQQQIDIMNYKANGLERKDAGVPKDIDGKAYEGHHMKSAEKYPDYQGQGRNIQALTRGEHQAAHNGNFQESTNGYYNPQTRETVDFGNADPIKLESSKLSQPYIGTAEYQYRTAANEPAPGQNKGIEAFREKEAENQGSTQSSQNEGIKAFNEKSGGTQQTTESSNKGIESFREKKNQQEQTGNGQTNDTNQQSDNKGQSTSNSNSGQSM